jgi:hypothetical protein
VNRQKYLYYLAGIRQKFRAWLSCKVSHTLKKLM